ncbi:MAG: hypothetical protein QOG67_2884 [Verrucomicrobiota bacterium]|jgi:hypothetical protein
MRFALVFLIGSILTCRAEERASGRWEGSVKIPERELKLVVDLAQQNAGTWTGSIIIPGLGIKGMALADISVRDNEVSFALKSPGGRGLDATFKGNLDANGDLTGNFVEAGNTAPFILKNTGAPQVEAAPHITSLAGEFEGEWKGEFELFGYPRHVTLKLTNSNEGATAELVIVGKKTTNVPVDLVEQEGEMVSIDSHQAGMGYEGRLNKGTHEIKGTFAAGGIELPLILRRTP